MAEALQQGAQSVYRADIRGRLQVPVARALRVQRPSCCAEEQATGAVRGLAIRAGQGTARPSFGQRAINSSASSRCFK